MNIVTRVLYIFKSGLISHVVSKDIQFNLDNSNFLIDRICQTPLQNLQNSYFLNILKPNLQ